MCCFKSCPCLPNQIVLEEGATLSYSDPLGIGVPKSAKGNKYERQDKQFRKNKKMMKAIV